MTRRPADRAEALDPRTPAPRLAALMGTHLADVLRNPALPLLLVEHPDFWSLLPRSVQAKVARSARCPPEFAAWLLRRDAPEVLELIANRALPAAQRRAALLSLRFAHAPADMDALRGATLDFLAADEAALLARALGGGPVAAAECVPLAALGGLGQWFALTRRACPPAVLVGLLEHGDPSAAEAALGHPNLPAELVAAAVVSPEVAVRIAVAANPALTAAQRDALAIDPDERVRRALR